MINSTAQLKDKLTTLHFFLKILHNQTSGSVNRGIKTGLKHYNVYIVCISI